MWIVVKARTRNYGFCLEWDGCNRPSYSYTNWIGWYRTKKAASQRARELNLSYVRI